MTALLDFEAATARIAAAARPASQFNALDMVVPAELAKSLLRACAPEPSAPGGVAAGQQWHDGRKLVRVLAVGGGYALVRKRGLNPFVVSTDVILAAGSQWRMTEP